MLLGSLVERKIESARSPVHGSSSSIPRSRQQRKGHFHRDQCGKGRAAGDTEADVPMLEAAEARIVVDNQALFGGDEKTLHLSLDSTSDGGAARLRAIIAQTLDR